MGLVSLSIMSLVFPACWHFALHYPSYCSCALCVCIYGPGLCRQNFFSVGVQSPVSCTTSL